MLDILLLTVDVAFVAAFTFAGLLAILGDRNHVRRP